MKVYLLHDSDFQTLTAAIDRDPHWGTEGGSSQPLNPEEREAHERAHHFARDAARWTRWCAGCGVDVWSVYPRSARACVRCGTAWARERAA